MDSNELYGCHQVSREEIVQREPPVVQERRMKIPIYVVELGHGMETDWLENRSVEKCVGV